MLLKGAALLFLIGVLSYLIYVSMYPENRDYNGNIPGEQISFLSGRFNENVTMTPKIEGFDTFKSYGELPVVGKLYTTTKAVRPYSSIIESGSDPTENLNNTIDIADKDIDIADSSIDVTGEDKILDTSSSLSGMNGGIEASLRESMVKSELRRLRR